jgi:glucuronokinase
MKFYDVDIPIHILPTIVLKAETDELGINAGLQDRVIQVYEGCVFMDFEKKALLKNGFGKYERIDPSLLPKLYLAYKVELGKVSGAVLNNIREKYDKGDKMVLETLGEMADLAEQGKQAILEKDYVKLNSSYRQEF